MGFIGMGVVGGMMGEGGMRGVNWMMWVGVMAKGEDVS